MNVYTEIVVHSGGCLAPKNVVILFFLTFQRGSRVFNKVAVARNGNWIWYCSCILSYLLKYYTYNEILDVFKFKSKLYFSFHLILIYIVIYNESVSSGCYFDFLYKVYSLV